MFDNAINIRALPLLVAAAFANPLAAAPARDLAGQWIGTSLLDGQNEPARTTLDLGADDEGSTLRIESRTTCTLKRGNYAPAQVGEPQAWTLSFKSASGGDACARLAQGTFVFRPGAAPRTLELDIVYPGRDGGSNHRRGRLSRYP
jgi:hypothetical protein